MIISVRPSLAAVTGGAVIKVLLGGVHSENSGMTCQFGYANPVSAVHINLILEHVSAIKDGAWSHQLTASCIAPIAAAGIIDLTIYVNEGVGAGKIPFMFVPPVTIGNILPIAGSAISSTVVTITGKNFRNTDELCCAFGEVMVPALWIASSRIACRPPFSSYQFVSVQVSNNGVEFVGAEHSFQYTTNPSIHHLMPSVATTKGGIVMTVVVSNFAVLSSTVLEIDGIRVPLSVLNWTTGVAVLPRHVQGNTTVRMSNDGATFSQDVLTLIFVTNPVVTRIQPTVGKMTGGSLVTVFGSHFIQNSTFCRFGNLMSIPAIVNSSEVLACTAPAISSSSARVKVQVSPNDVEFSDIAGEFEYVSAPSVHFLVPSRSSSQASIQVTVVGSHFSKPMQIQVGDLNPIDAVFVSSSIALCRLPSQSRKVNVSVTALNTDTDIIGTEGSKFVFGGEEDHSNLVPSMGPMRGGTEIMVIGRDRKSVV